MAFPELVKATALIRAGHRCQCTRKGHGHVSRCGTTVSRATAHFHHITAQLLGGADSASNCEVLCVSCHRLTASYGRH